MDQWTWGWSSISGKLAAMQEKTGQPSEPTTPEREPESPPVVRVVPAVREVGGPQGPEPTRYGDWEKAGRCIDF
jgi:hypothetical protein